MPGSSSVKPSAAAFVESTVNLQDLAPCQLSEQRFAISTPTAISVVRVGRTALCWSAWASVRPLCCAVDAVASTPAVRSARLPKLCCSPGSFATVDAGLEYARYSFKLRSPRRQALGGHPADLLLAP